MGRKRINGVDKRQNFCVTFPPELIDRLQVLADWKIMSVSALAERLITDVVDKEYDRMIAEANKEIGNG